MGTELQSHQAEAGPAEEPPSRWLIDTPEPPTMWQELVKYIRTNVLSKKSYTRNKNNSSNPVYSCLKSLFPIISWGKQYKLKMFKKDFMAGLTLASLSIPQSLGYANLAGLGPEDGLYTSVVPPLIYSTLGSSRELGIGPVAVVSLLLSSMVKDLQNPVADPIAYRKIVFTVTSFRWPVSSHVWTVQANFKKNPFLNYIIWTDVCIWSNEIKKKVFPPNTIHCKG